MAPEQARGTKPEPRSDLFSLGAVLYRMLTGEQPFQGTDIVSLLTALAIDTPERPALRDASIPPELDALVMQLLAKKPQDRPASGHEVAEQLSPLVPAQSSSRHSKSISPASGSFASSSNLSTSDPTFTNIAALAWAAGVLYVSDECGVRSYNGFGWTTLVAAEMVAASVGLGQMVLNASNFLRTDIVIMGIVVIGVVAYAFDLLMRWVERKLVPWKGRM
jgi:serine/threonine protein kinase